MVMLNISSRKSASGFMVDLPFSVGQMAKVKLSASDSESSWRYVTPNLLIIYWEKLGFLLAIFLSPTIRIPWWGRDVTWNQISYEECWDLGNLSKRLDASNLDWSMRTLSPSLTTAPVKNTHKEQSGTSLELSNDLTFACPSGWFKTP